MMNETVQEGRELIEALKAQKAQMEDMRAVFELGLVEKYGKDVEKSLAMLRLFSEQIGHWEELIYQTKNQIDSELVQDA